jgi:hypothetical protein
MARHPCPPGCWRLTPVRPRGRGLRAINDEGWERLQSPVLKGKGSVSSQPSSRGRWQEL